MRSISVIMAFAEMATRRSTGREITAEARKQAARMGAPNTGLRREKRNRSVRDWKNDISSLPAAWRRHPHFAIRANPNYRPRAEPQAGAREPDRARAHRRNRVRGKPGRGSSWSIAPRHVRG
jgi:hypothetical protein